jgi:hypothetical protein
MSRIAPHFRRSPRSNWYRATRRRYACLVTTLSPGNAHLQQARYLEEMRDAIEELGSATSENHQGVSMPRSRKEKLIFCGHIGCALICIILACLVVVEAKQYFYQNDTDISAISRRQ